MVKAWTGLLLDIVAVFTVISCFLVVFGIVFWGVEIRVWFALG